MTREEIRAQAEQLADELLGCRYPAEVRCAEKALLALVRATLQEAARAVCGDCTAGVQMLPQTAEWEWGHPDDDGYRYDCAAAPIHDLIAALEVEGDK